MQEAWVQSPGREDPLEKETATHCGVLAWKDSWMEGPGGLQSVGLREAEVTERRTHHHLGITELFAHPRRPRGSCPALDVSLMFRGSEATVSL